MKEHLVNDLEDLFDESLAIIKTEEEKLEEKEVLYDEITCSEYNLASITKREYKGEMTDNNPIDFDRNRKEKTEVSYVEIGDTIIHKIEETEEFQSSISKLRSELTGRDTLPKFSPEIRGDSISPKSQCYILLVVFLQKVTRLYLKESEEYVRDNKVRLISALSREIEGPQIRYDNTTYYYGLWMDYDSIRVTEDITLSKPTAEDIESETKLEDIQEPSLQLLPEKLPTMKIEFECKSTTYPETIGKEDRLVSLLRLFGMNGGDSVGRHITPKTPLRNSRHEWVNVNDVGGNFNTEIKRDHNDKYNLRVFFQNIEKHFDREIKNEDDSTYIKIAYNRYEMALMEDESWEAAVASLVMGLEALYLKESEQGELSQRLSQRCGVLMESIGDEPMEVYHKLKSGYGIRSQYVHGSKSDDDNINELATRIGVLLKDSINIFLQLSENMEKDEILSKLDSAIMTENSREKLNGLIEENCGYTPYR